MLDRVSEIPGHALGTEEYLADFWPYYNKIEDVFWKLERRQEFREPYMPSWVAMAEGDWDRSLRLIDDGRSVFPQDLRGDLGIEHRRVRIVEYPVSPYLQWSMQVLRLRAEAGERIRVLDAARVGDLEASRPLPELVVLGTSVLYEVVYDQTGTLTGARRVTEPAVVSDCRTELADLFDRGEDLLTYFEREIASLPPPEVGA